jgi:hypothetical protein
LELYHCLICQVEPTIKRTSPPDPLCIKYKLRLPVRSFTLAEVQKQVLKLKELKRNWNVVTLDDRITMQMMKLPYLLPEYEIVVDDSLGFTQSVFHWLLPENHELYKKHHR